MQTTSKKPRALVCYICGKEYGTKKIEKHIQICIQKWDEEQLKLEPELRRECPEAPPGFLSMVQSITCKEPLKDLDESIMLPTQPSSVKDLPLEQSQDDK